MIIGNKVELLKPVESDMNLLWEWRNNSNHRKYYREYRETNIDDQLNWFKSL